MRSGGNGKVEVVLAENRSAVWCWYLDTGQRRCLRLELRIRHHSNGDRCSLMLTPLALQCERQGEVNYGIGPRSSKSYITARVFHASLYFSRRESV